VSLRSFLCDENCLRLTVVAIKIKIGEGEVGWRVLKRQKLRFSKPTT